MAKLKVFSGSVTVAGKQYSVIVTTTSQKKAAEIAGTTVGDIRNYWLDTRNETDIALGMQNPDKMVVYRSEWHGDREVLKIVNNEREFYDWCRANEEDEE